MYGIVYPGKKGTECPYAYTPSLLPDLGMVTLWILPYIPAYINKIRRYLLRLKYRLA